MPHLHTGEGQFDFTVAAYLVHDKKTLLIKHKYLPLWTPPAGHIELNQTPIDALYAEIKEEAGIDQSHLELIETSPQTKELPRGESTVLPIPFDMEYHTISDTHRHINLAYIMKSDTDQIEPGEGESSTFKWFAVDELHEFNDTNASIKNAAIYAINYVSKLSR